MMNRSHRFIRHSLVFYLLAGLILSGCSSPPVETPEPAPVGVDPPVYGLVYPYPPYAWEIADSDAMRTNFARIKSLGIETVIQAFPASLIGSEKEANLSILLDEARRADIRVIASLWPSIEKEDNSIDYQAIYSLLTVIKDHPALQGYLGLHEPLERFTSDQLREFYSTVKSMAPDLPLAHFMGNIAGFDHNVRFPNRDFTAGICDICLVWYYPASIQGDQFVFKKEEYRKYLVENRDLLAERAPGAEMWVLGQAFSVAEHEPALRMPSPEEMQDMFVIAYQERVDGILWYPWLHDSYDTVLSDVGMEGQQEAIRQIYQKFILPGPQTSSDP